MPLFSTSQGKSSSGTENPKIECGLGIRVDGVAEFPHSRYIYTAFTAQPQFKSICLGLINPIGHPTLRQRHAQAAHYCETACDI